MLTNLPIHRSHYGCDAFINNLNRFAELVALVAIILGSMASFWHRFGIPWSALDRIFDHLGNAGDLQASHGSGMGAPKEI